MFPAACSRGELYSRTIVRLSRWRRAKVGILIEARRAAAPEFVVSCHAGAAAQNLLHMILINVKAAGLSSAGLRQRHVTNDFYLY
jgi:hypothetical protein